MAPNEMPLVVDAEEDSGFAVPAPRSQESPKIVVRRNFPETFLFTDINFGTT
jgi:hypothetical protein